MLGQPVSMLIPEVVGFKLHGKLPPGATATDLVLTVHRDAAQEEGRRKVRRVLRRRARRRLRCADRATIANMAPEYGATMGFFPVRRRDAQVPAALRPAASTRSSSSRRTPRRRDSSAPTPRPIPIFTDTLELDLGTVEPSLAGPKRPQDRVPLSQSKTMYARRSPPRWRARRRATAGKRERAVAGAARRRRGRRAAVADERGRSRASTTANTFTLKHGAVVIAAITSCTNTSNPR